MEFKVLMVFLFFISSCFGQTFGCLLKNITCCDQQIPAGFQFIHECHKPIEVEVVDSNETKIAYFDSKRNTSMISPDVVKIDSHSVITESCRDLSVKYFTNTDLNTVEETRVCFNVIDEATKCQNETKQYEKAAKAAIISIAVLGIFALLLCCYFYWTKYLRKQQKSAAVATFLPDVVTCSCCKKGDFPESRNQNGSGFQMVTRDVESHSVTNIRNGIDLSESGENDPDNMLETVRSGDTGAPNITSHFHHRPMNSNLRDDPGGHNDTKTRNIIGEGDGGRTAGSLKTEDSETKRQPLLDQRAVDKGLDMTGEAEALVYKASLGHVSRCSDEPVIDVESRYKEEPVE